MTPLTVDDIDIQRFEFPCDVGDNLYNFFRKNSCQILMHRHIQLKYFSFYYYEILVKKTKLCVQKIYQTKRIIGSQRALRKKIILL